MILILVSVNKCSKIINFVYIFCFIYWKTWLTGCNVIETTMKGIITMFEEIITSKELKSNDLEKSI